MTGDGHSLTCTPPNPPLPVDRAIVHGMSEPKQPQSPSQQIVGVIIGAVATACLVCLMIVGTVALIRLMIG